jgi:AcrR family transcriptional regulator
MEKNRMNVIDGAGKRSRGRPRTRSDDETRHVIAEAAHREFIANGYAKTNIDKVAKSAGVSKKTLYRLVPTKADLFRRSIAHRVGQFMLALDHDEIEKLDIRTALERTLIAVGNLALSGEAIAIQRLVLSEGQQFPELAASFYAEAISATRRALEDYLENQCACGSLDLADPHLAADMLRGMMIMEPQRAAMMEQRGIPDSHEIAVRAATCARIFLEGCRKAS